MDVKSFVLGVASGVAACGVCYFLDAGPDQFVNSISSKRQGRSTAGADVESNRLVSSSDVALLSPRKRALPQAADRLAAPASVTPSAQPQSREGQHLVAANKELSAPADRAPASDERAPHGAPSSWPPPRGVLMKEPKDPDWSFYMEQTLRQYLADHPKASQFDFRSIDCRRTFCQVVALGFDQSTVPVWNQLIYDLQQQPWNAFDMTAGEVGSESGKPLLSTRLHRASSTVRAE